MRLLVQDIMWRQALFIADMSVTSVKKRFDLVGVDRLPHYLSGGFEGANFRVGKGKMAWPVVELTIGQLE